jgi:hypothetical protein
MSLTSYINSNQEELIELDIDYNVLSAQGVAKGTIDNFSVSFSQTINLNSNSDYDIGIQYIHYTQPYPYVEDSYFLYCSLVEQSRIGSDVGNVLHKTLTSYSTTLGKNDGSLFFCKASQRSTIIDWKKLNVKDFSTIDFIFKSSSGIPYPIGIASPFPKNLVIKVVIRQSPTSKNSTSRLLGKIF